MADRPDEGAHAIARKWRSVRSGPKHQKMVVFLQQNGRVIALAKYGFGTPSAFHAKVQEQLTGPRKMSLLASL